MNIKSIGVFCGSSVGSQPQYAEAAAQLGQKMAQQQINLIYGGGNVGLMGVIADAALALDGKVVGIIPQFLMDKEVGHHALSKMWIVESMSERKNKINDLSDAFIAMPGGFGTLDEVMEVLTYFQLGMSEKPVAFLNTLGYFDHLLLFLDHVLDQKFMKYEHRHNLIVANTPDELLQKLHEFTPLAVDEKWIKELKQKQSF